MILKLVILVFFYHSSCTPPGIAGIIEVVKEGYPDPTALNPESQYLRPALARKKSHAGIWSMSSWLKHSNA